MSGFVTNVLITLGRQLIAIALGIVSFVLIARVLGPEGQGSYSLIVLSVVMLASFFSFGIADATIYHVGKERSRVHQTVATNMVLGFALGCLAALAGVVLIALLSDTFFNGIKTEYLYMMAVLLPAIMMGNLGRSLFAGLEDFKTHGALSLLHPLLFFASLLLLYAMGHFELLYILIAYIVAQLLSLLAVLALLRSKGYRLFEGGASLPDMKKFLLFGSKNHINDVLAFINQRIDAFLISYFLGVASVGIYIVAITLSEKFHVLTQSVSSVLFARVANLQTDDDKRKTTTLAARNVLSLSLIAGFVVFSIAEWLIAVLFGQAYAESLIPFLILFLGGIISSVSRVISNFIAAYGKPEINMYVGFFLLFENVVLNMLFIPIYGLPGAAMATSLTYATNVVIKIYFYIRITGEKLGEIIIPKRSDLGLYRAYLDAVWRRE